MANAKPQSVTGPPLAGQAMVQTHPEDAALFPEMQNLPPPATATQLGANERWYALPDHLRIQDLQARGYNNVWHGRNEELQRLHQAFPPRNGTTVETNHEIMLAYGAQGSGKSALMTRFQREAECEGIACIQLDETAFRSDEDFIGQLMDSDLWRRASRWRRHRDRLAKATQQLATGVGVTATLSALGIETGGQLTVIADTARMPLGRPASVIDALQRLDDHCSGGFIFAVDEVQRWRSHGPDTAAKRIASLIGDPTARQGADIRTGGLLLCGLTDSMAVLRDLDITRHQSMAIGALSPLSARNTLEQHLRSAGVDRELENAMGGRWAEVLTRDFGMWPHHTTCAANAAKHVLADIQADWQQDPKNYDMATAIETGLDQVRTIAGRGVRGLYEVRLGLADAHPSKQATSDLVLLALRTGNTIRESSVEHLIRQHLERNGQPADDATVRTTVRELQHTGFLEPILNEEHARTGYLAIPIPSMARHVVEIGRPDPNVETVEAALAAPQREAAAEGGTPWAEALAEQTGQATENGSNGNEPQRGNIDEENTE